MQARRDEIVAAAIKAIAEKGISRTSMADIIAGAGLSVGAVYGHFEGKREILAAAAHRLLARRRDELDAALAQGRPPSPGEAVALLLGGMLSDGVEPRALIQVWAEAATDPEILGIMREAAGQLQETLRRALRAWFAAHPEQAPDGVDAAIRRLLPVLVALGQGFVVQRGIFEEFDSDAYFETVRTLLPH
jgi:AcrR family transcriptional regulator